MLNQATISPAINPTLSGCNQGHRGWASMVGRLVPSRRERCVEAVPVDTGLEDAPRVDRPGRVGTFESIRDRQAEVTILSLRA
jgi:hypothetical protein